jgi:endonuclease YncB( thermonuclease family)
LQYRCGAKSANDLDAFITKRPVSCTPISLDQYGRTVATCSVSANGWFAMALRSTGPSNKGKYSGAQRDAEHAGRGIWAGSYVEPWLY